MKQIEHLLILRNEFDQVEPNGKIKISVKGISDVLSISIRNVNFLLKKMHEDRQIIWTPGRGRGNVSSISFFHSFNALAKTYIRAMVDEYKIEEIIHFIDYSNLSNKNKELLYKYLQDELEPKIEHTPSRDDRVIKMLLPQKILRIDPVHVYLSSEAFMISHLFNTLVKFNSSSGDLEPGIAYAWKENREGKEWTFFLRKAIKFHNGEELTSEDVKFTFNRILQSNKDTSVYSLLSEINEIKTIDDYTVAFYLADCNYFFPRILSSYNCSILCHRDADMNRVNGTGPFKVKELSETFISLAAFDAYFKERALIDRFEIWLTQDKSYHPLQPAKLNVPLSNHQGKQILSRSQTIGSRLIAFNGNKNHPVIDDFLKHALIKLFNPKAMTEELKGNRTLPSSSFLPSQSMTHTFLETKLEKVKLLLKESKYSGEIIKLYYCDISEGEESAKWLRDQAAKAEITLSLHSTFPTEPIDHFREADIILFPITFADEDVELNLFSIFKENSFLRQFLPSEAKRQIDYWLKVFQKKKETGNRLSELLEIEEYLKKELCLHFLYHTNKALDYSPNLKGIEINSYGLTNFHKLWVEPDLENIDG